MRTLARRILRTKVHTTNFTYCSRSTEQDIIIYQSKVQQGKATK